MCIRDSSHGQLHVVAKQFAFIAPQTDEHTVYIGMLDTQLLDAKRQAHASEKVFQSGSTCQSHLFQIFGLGYIKNTMGKLGYLCRIDVYKRQV